MRDNKATIDRYLLPYFKGRAIEAIHQEQIEAYKLWRLTYWTTGPRVEQTTRESDRPAPEIDKSPCAGLLSCPASGPIRDRRALQLPEG